MNSSNSEKLRNFPVQENLQRLSSGCVLLARENLQDSNFEASVILLCIHNEEGAYGLVVNRISHMPVSEIFDGFKDVDYLKEFYIGGPVSQEELQILEITEEPAKDAYKLGSRVFMGGQWDDIGKMLDSDPSTTHIFLGYSGWAPGQIEAEVEAGTWDVYTVDVEKLLTYTHSLAQMSTEEISKVLNYISIQS